MSGKGGGAQGQGQGKSGGGYSIQGGSGGGSGSGGYMKAPGGGALDAYISRATFENNPKGYFSGLHAAEKNNK
ncbi:hypothetical protein CR513_57051, partial [Mucuna pruriens]